MDGALSQGLMHAVDLERYSPDVLILQRQIGDERLEAMRRMKAFSSAFKVYELDDYLPNFKRMFGEATMEAVVGSVDGSVRSSLQ